MANDSLKVNSKNCPRGEFIFAAIVGAGVYNEDKEEYERKVTLEVDIDDAQSLLDEIDDFVEDNAVKGKDLVKVPYQTHEDYDGIPKGKIWLQAKTSVEFEDKRTGEVKQTVINIYDSQGNKTKLPDGVGIGKGSTGIIIGTIKMWERRKEYGASLYLSGLQIGDFVPYEFEDVPEAMEGSFKGFNDLQKDEDADDEKQKRERRSSRDRSQRRSRA